MYYSNFTKIDKSYCYEAIRQKSLIVKIKFKQCVYSNKLIDSSIYIGILVAGLEALCVCSATKSSVLFTGFRKKVNVVLGIHKSRFK